MIGRYGKKGIKSEWQPFTGKFIFALIFLCLALTAAPLKAFSASGDIQKIREDLNNMDWEVRLATLEKLRNMKSKEVVDVLLEVARAKGDRNTVKITAIQLLGETGDPRAIEVLLPIFNDSTLNWECPAIKSYAATALGYFKGDSRVVDTLISGLDDSELLTREASIQSLGKIGSMKAVPYLIRALKDDHVSIRLSAVRSLGEIGDAQALPHLRKVEESDSDPVVKSQARSALNNFRSSNSTHAVSGPSQ